jgi:hypothetical protein
MGYIYIEYEIEWDSWIRIVLIASNGISNVNKHS